MKFEGIRIIHKKVDDIRGIESYFLPDHAVETCGWKFDYKGKKHGCCIAGTRDNPLTDESMINLMEHMVKYMRKLKGEEDDRERYTSSYRDII